MVDGEWSYSILLFQREERKGKGACEVTLGSRTDGQTEDAATQLWIDQRWRTTSRIS
jgi:hypothetical protein